MGVVPAERPDLVCLVSAANRHHDIPLANRRSVLVVRSSCRCDVLALVGLVAFAFRLYTLRKSAADSLATQNKRSTAASDAQRARSARLAAMWRRSRRAAPRQAATVAARVGCCRDPLEFPLLAASSRSYRGSRQGSRECRLAGCLEGGRSASRVLAMLIAITQGRKLSPLFYRPKKPGARPGALWQARALFVWLVALGHRQRNVRRLRIHRHLERAGAEERAEGARRRRPAAGLYVPVTRKVDAKNCAVM
jgi:hypothetical protein